MEVFFEIQLDVIKIFVYQVQVFPKGFLLQIAVTLSVGHSRIYSINCFQSILALKPYFQINSKLKKNEKSNTQTRRQLSFIASNKLEQRKRQIQINTRTKCHLVDPQAPHRIWHSKATDRI